MIYEASLKIKIIKNLASLNKEEGSTPETSAILVFCRNGMLRQSYTK